MQWDIMLVREVFPLKLNNDLRLNFQLETLVVAAFFVFNRQAINKYLLLTSHTRVLHIESCPVPETDSKI